MKNLKFYINSEAELNEYEKEHKKISYARLIHYLFTDMVLCNALPEFLSKKGTYLDDNIECGRYYNEDEDYYEDIYQYFIVDFSNVSYDFIKKYCQDELLLFYLDELDLYVLGVTHCGTAWGYVLTDFEYTTDWDNSMQGNLYKEGKEDE